MVKYRKALRTDPQHRFTWDEQVSNGYNLVPTIIHGSFPHTGLVSSSSSAKDYFEERRNDSPQKYSWDESNAPDALSEFLQQHPRKMYHHIIPFFTLRR